MQYLKISKELTLSSLSSIVGERNVDTVLNANSLTRSVKVGEAFDTRNKLHIEQSADVDYQSKINILNQLVGDSDLYEKIALSDEDDWKLFAQYNCYSDAIKIPDEVKLPPSEGVLGNNIPVESRVHQHCIVDLLSEVHAIDPKIFADYNASFSGNYFGATSTNTQVVTNFANAFRLPFNKICLYSSLSGEFLYFPVYPKSIDNTVRANYEEMPEMIYQYEPWTVYKSSGPRELTFTFEFHRDMWSAMDHRDGEANKLVRGCQANCYPRFNGSLVNVSTVTLYISGQNYITGVMTDCKDTWDGPIGLDDYYLKCTLSFTIKEI